MPTFRERHGRPQPSEDQAVFVFQGEELTDQRAEQLAAQVLIELRRRNLLSRRVHPIPPQGARVEFRVSAAQRVQLDRRAAAEGVSPAEIARRALDAYLGG